MPRDLATSLVYARSKPLVGRLAYYALKLLGVEMPLSVRIGTRPGAGARRVRRGHPPPDHASATG